MKILIMGLLVSLFFAPPVHSGMVIGSGAPTAIEVAVASASIAINSSSLPSEDIVSDVSSYNWGTVAQGSPSSHTFTFINQSMSNYSLLAPTYTGTNSADFATNTDSCTGTLLSHTSCTTSVNFTPGATGARSGAMNVSWMPAIAVNVASASIATAALSGEGGAAATCNATPFDTCGSDDYIAITAYNIGEMSYYPAADRNICQIEFALTTAPTTGSCTARIYNRGAASGDGYDLGTLVCSSETIAYTSLSGGGAYNAFNITGDCNLTGGGGSFYMIILDCDGNDITPRINWTTGCDLGGREGAGARFTNDTLIYVDKVGKQWSFKLHAIP